MWKPYISQKYFYFDGPFYSLIQGIFQPILILSLYGYCFYGMFTEQIDLVLWKFYFLDLSLQWAIILPFYRHKILISVFDGIKVCKCKVNWTLRNNYIASSLLYIRIYSYWWIKNHNYLATFRHKTSDWYTTHSV